MYLTAAGKDYKARIQIAARKRMYRTLPTLKEVEVCITYYRPSRRGDIDGPSKFVLDAMNGIVYADDAQVMLFIVRKDHDPKNPRTVITVSEL
jgi:Holliday junction resolvase RusA-like endonuclease